MGRLGCNCGATMSSVDCPSPNIVHIFEEKEVNKALENNPSIRLWDFRSMRRKYEYWYCTSCRRVHQVNVETGYCVLRYTPIGKSEDQIGIMGIPAGWQELYVITDVELDDVTERDFSITLAEYLPKVKRRVMLSPDQQTAVVFDAETGIELERYITEAVPTIE